jgi:hypothetical protein
MNGNIWDSFLRGCRPQTLSDDLDIARELAASLGDGWSLAGYGSGTTSSHLVDDHVSCQERAHYPHLVSPCSRVHRVESERTVIIRGVCLSLKGPT